jgi:hypothetical protein
VLKETSVIPLIKALVEVERRYKAARGGTSTDSE